jgi:nitroreductase
MMRRSIRSYLEQEVEDQKITQLLKAAMAAPTACNNQPWEFIVVNDKEVLGKLKSKLTFGRYNAPLAIVVCGNMELAKGGYENYWVQDCSAAMENILLTASGLGLGSIWIGVYPLPSVIKSVREVLNIPELVIPLGIAYVGYTDENKEPRTQYNERRIYRQQYDITRKHRARPKNLKHL